MAKSPHQNVYICSGKGTGPAIQFGMQPNVEKAHCWHCGQYTNIGTSFCCAGCQTAYEFLSGHGLGEYYNLSRCEGVELRPPPPVSKSHYTYCDDPEFVAQYTTDGQTLTVYVEGVHCASCLWLLEKLPDYCPDAEFARLDFSRSLLTVKRKLNGSFAMIAETLHQLGYPPKPVQLSDAGHELRQKEERQILLRLGIAAAGAGNIMILAIANYAGAGAAFRDLFIWISAAIAVPVLTYCTWPLYVRVYHDLLNRRISLDVPIVFAILSGVIVSTISIVKGEGEIYFDSLTTLVFLLTASRYLLRRIQSHNLDSSANASLALICTVERRAPSAEKFELVSSLSLKAGDRLKPSRLSVLPVDGIVREQSLWVDRSVLTGESTPVEILPGSPVEAGMKFLEGEGQVEVTATGPSTRISKLLSQANQLSQMQPTFVRTGDTVGRWFTLTVMLVAASLFAYFFTQDLAAEGLRRALALIIVTCPCVFGMAIPLAYSLALKNAARSGILIKDSETLEKLLKITSAYFDKTGTLTTGKMKVIQVEPPNPPARFQRAAYALEKESVHPVAVAIRETTCGLFRLPSLTMVNVENIAGGGRRAQIENEIFTLRPIGAESDAETICGSYGLFCNDVLVVTYRVQDELREDAAATVRDLNKLNIKTHIFSGDREAPVRACANQAGIAQSHVHFSMTPEDKVLGLQKDTGTLMVGDGANDAGALSAANIGLAVCGAVEVSLRSAPIYLLKPNLGLIPKLVKLAHQVRRVIYANLTLSTTFNLVAGGLAISGHMNALTAALLMPLSSLTILFITTVMSRVREA